MHNRARFVCVSVAGIDENSMRDKIFCITGFLLSILLLASAWNTHRLFGNDAFETSQKALLIVGGLLLIGSIYTLIKKPNEPKN